MYPESLKKDKIVSRFLTKNKKYFYKFTLYIGLQYYITTLPVKKANLFGKGKNANNYCSIFKRNLFTFEVLNID